MQGLLADVNVAGHIRYLSQLLEALDLSSILAEIGLRLATFSDLSLPRDIDDRQLWNRRQADRWVLCTENRNRDGPDSLEATIRDSWQDGFLPVLTLANKNRFQHDRSYADRVANDVAELLFGIAQGEYLDEPRIYLPRQSH